MTHVNLFIYLLFFQFLTNLIFAICQWSKALFGVKLYPLPFLETFDCFLLFGEGLNNTFSDGKIIRSSWWINDVVYYSSKRLQSV